jgi:hypothetical protein
MLLLHLFLFLYLWYEEKYYYQHNLLSAQYVALSVQHISLAVSFHLSQFESEVSSSPPWASSSYPGQLIFLWDDFYLSLSDPAFGSTSLQLLEPSDKNLPPFRWLPCSSHPECRISDHSCIWKPFHHRSPDDLP